ncbi:MAG: hypothetical protein K0R38_682 [Polyangiaceae bacterium]|jgi:hypothetical protein|nr:hypothetical protein [Polyangiaceae bacterium]
MSQRARSAAISTLITALCFGALGCGQDEVKYQPRPASSGAKPSLPPAANLPKRPLKNGDAYTVWGASYSLRSRTHRKEVAGKRLAIQGYITKSNMQDAPACAVHKAGKADPESCKAPVPAFWIGDTKDAPEADCIKVMGWASNFAQIFDAIDEYDKGKENAEYNDANWGVKVPNPLPAVGAKVTVTGQYGVSFSKASSGAEADPFMGVIDFQEMTVQEPAAELATLPGKKRKAK